MKIQKKKKHLDSKRQQVSCTRLLFSITGKRYAPEEGSFWQWYLFRGECSLVHFQASFHFMKCDSLAFFCISDASVGSRTSCAPFNTPP